MLLRCLRHHAVQRFHLCGADDAVAEHALALVHPQAGEVNSSSVRILICLLWRDNRCGSDVDTASFEYSHGMRANGV